MSNTTAATMAMELRPDPTTGFLQSPRHDGISAQVKAEILELFRQCGDLSAASRAMNVDPRVIRWHRENDPEFKAAHQQAWEEILDRAEGAIYRNLDKTPADRIFILKTRRSAIYGDRPQRVEHSVTVVNRLKDRATAYDAELVPPTTTAPEQTTARRADDSTEKKRNTEKE